MLYGFLSTMAVNWSNRWSKKNMDSRDDLFLSTMPSSHSRWSNRCRKKAHDSGDGRNGGRSLKYVYQWTVPEAPEIYMYISSPIIFHHFVLKYLCSLSMLSMFSMFWVGERLSNERNFIFLKGQSTDRIKNPKTSKDGSTSYKVAVGLFVAAVIFIFLAEVETRTEVSSGAMNSMSEVMARKYSYKEINIVLGLAYIIHLDVKPQNILLHENFVANVSD